MERWAGPGRLPIVGRCRAITSWAAAGTACLALGTTRPRDATVNPVNGDQVIAQVTTAADLRTSVSRGEAPGGLGFTRTVKTDASGRSVLEQWVLHGAGHTWSGGSPAGSYTEPRGPDASREMIRFFLQHPAAAASGG